MLQSESEASLRAGTGAGSVSRRYTGLGGSGPRKQKGDGHPMQAYCLKCRTKRDMQNPTQVTMKNGKQATKGNCPVCSTAMYRIGKS